ncbi:MAG: hypothetical protein HFE97_09500 [Oscillospiraceae bacterium]|nr:hypothetical protein [Oscillospiraceae bacterium]
METTYFVIHTKHQTEWEEEACRASGGTALTCIRIPKPCQGQKNGTILWLDDYRSEALEEPDLCPEPPAPPVRKKWGKLEVFLDACATAALVGLSAGLLIQFLR